MMVKFLASTLALAATVRVAGLLTVQILMAPDRVEAFRVAPHLDRKQLRQTRQWIGEYPVIQSGTSRQKEKAVQVAGAVLSATGSLKRCAFQPGYAVRYWQGTRSVSLLFCFRCAEVRILPPPASGEPVFGVDFGKVSVEIVKFLQAEFPDDRDLAALK